MKRLLILAGTALIAFTAQASAEGDPANGEKVFRKCAACHAVGEDARNKVGPQLNGVIGRDWGTIEGYKYSSSLMEGAGEGRTWDVETLDAYLLKPRDVIPKGRMAFAGLRKDEDRADVIAYLAQYSEDGTTN